MKKGILLTEQEKKRILGLYNLINEQQDYSSYASQKINYPPCVQALGSPVKITPNPQTWFPYAIMGKGATKGFMFYPYRIGLDYKPIKTSGFWVNKPNTTGQEGRVSFACQGNDIVIEGKTYKTRTVPTTIDQLAQGGYYLTLNDKGDVVKRVQNQLISAGEDVVATGTYDNNTLNAVKSFQTKNKLKSDGVVGKLTWGKLSKVLPYSDGTIARKEVTQIPTSSTPKDVVPLANSTPSQSIAQTNTSVEY